MFGLILSAIYVGWCTINKTPLEASVDSAANFLWCWYITFTCISAIALGIRLLFFSDTKIRLTKTFFYMIVTPIYCTLCIVGAQLVSLAGDASMSISTWDMPKLITGGIMLTIMCLYSLSCSIGILQIHNDVFDAQ